jgi:hypothetical protein
LVIKSYGLTQQIGHWTNLNWLVTAFSKALIGQKVKSGQTMSNEKACLYAEAECKILQLNSVEWGKIELFWKVGNNLSHCKTARSSRL